jgi:voltage-gated potassium channel
MFMKAAFYIIGFYVFFTLLFSLVLYLIFDENDINYDKETKFIDLWYFSITTYTSTGYGDIVPISTRARIITSLYMLISYCSFIILSIFGFTYINNNFIEKKYYQIN